MFIVFKDVDDCRIAINLNRIDYLELVVDINREIKFSIEGNITEFELNEDEYQSIDNQLNGLKSFTG